MDGKGPFLWLSDSGPPAGFRSLPPGGMCLSVFLFVRRGDRILLGKYADDPRWEELTGLDESRRREHGVGWTIPASHLRFGEDPRDAARRIAFDVLGLARHAVSFTEPRVETEVNEPRRFPGQRNHFDVWFLVDATLSESAAVERPPWFAALDWHDPRALPDEEWGRSHEDVARRWLYPESRASSTV